MAPNQKKKIKPDEQPLQKKNKATKSILTKQYDEDKLKKALYDIRNGMAIRTASRNYNIPRGTLQDRVHGRVAEGVNRKGPSTVLSKAEEDALANWCRNLVKCGFPLKKEDLLNTVAQIIKSDGRQTPFTDGRPGIKWYKAFMNRNKLTPKTPETISKGRAVITEQLIESWFIGLKNFLKEENAEDILEDPERIINGDEMSLQICPKTEKVIAPVGYKNVHQVSTGPEKEAITALLFFTASGQTLNPCVVLPHIRPPCDVIESLPEGWILGKSESGWMKTDIFYDYFVKSLNPWLTDKKIKKPVLVLVDGHKSHLTLKISEYCANNGIILYALPPNTAHMMPPADVSLFKPLKNEWTETVHNWQMQPENVNCHSSKIKFMNIK
ncbi:uncharacterized protein LOC130672420 [Microplitis mediator]|uniref:uncharacterized protein LOC130672420 n=1 Tax=Microplitis mediator TaxID=375433 RepID=UPI0025550893|nr:uncharacterized protein LOC130672420 [Microplitis mediator]